ncbi:homoserine kinase [Novosphingopyxis sp.]|uniref:homoserine kinase n=1 Tax=Novosphingopyxis sp. TaxID=2709690 RepID=UPI003B5925C2
MAVYTHVSPDDLAALLARYDVGAPRACKGIAEGVENSNFLVETSKDRFILTLYENRVDAGDLPFFIDLVGHLAAADLPVPAFIPDREGRFVQPVAGRPAALIAFLNGISPDRPDAAQAAAIGKALARMHAALADFEGSRPNSMNRRAWRVLAERCDAADLNAIRPGLAKRIDEELDLADRSWPDTLPHAPIHADLFPDNVLMLDGEVTGIIDFYFACRDIRVYDLAVTHAAWCFAPDGMGFDETVSEALITAYRTGFGLTGEEQTALPMLARGACLRFLLTRAHDWIATPPDALVTRKDPLAFLRRLDFYRAIMDGEAVDPFAANNFSGDRST